MTVTENGASSGFAWIKQISVAEHLVLHTTLDLAVGLGTGDGISLIIELLASAKAQFNLQFGVFEVHSQRNEGKALLSHEALQLHDLPLMHEQLAVTQRLTVEDITVLIGANVNTNRKQFAVLNATVGVLEVDTTRTDGLDLGAKSSIPASYFSSTK